VLADVEAEAAQQKLELDETVKTLNQTEAAFERQTKELADSQHILRNAETSVAQKDAELTDTRKEIKDLRKAITEARQHVLTVERINQSLKREADLEHAHVQTLSQQNELLIDDKERAKEKELQVLVDHEKHLGQLRVELATTKIGVDTRHSELAQMTNLLMQAETRLQQSDQARQEAEAGQADINAILAAILPLRRKYRFWRSAASRLREEMEAVRNTGLFDGDWYLRNNSDVSKAGMDALRHYVLFGLGEGRAPRAPFSERNFIEPVLLSQNDFSEKQK
jgi:chromosome segregation ATPase